MKYFRKVEGNRIYLSPMCVEDAEKYVKWFSNRKTSDGLHQTSKLYNVESEREWIENSLKSNKEYNFAIVNSINDELLGNCGISNINYIDRCATVGIFIGDEENRNKGYGSEALNLLLNYGFNFLNLHNIKLDVFSFNERAIGCYNKVGFKECGRRHECCFLDGKYYDSISMEILEQDYREMNKKL